MKEKNNFGLIRLIGLCIVVIVLMVAPPLVLYKQKSNSITGEELWGESSEYQGVLEVWNIDTFSGAYMSKSDFLNEVARRFECRNKGVFVCIKNMKVEEFGLALKEGRLPSVVSFGWGIGNLVLEQLETLTGFENVNEKILESGKKNGELKAVGYIMSMYGLFSSTEKIGKLNEDSTLSQVMFSSGKDIAKKKGSKHIYSLNYGKSKYVHPENVFLENGKDYLISENEYTAYNDFINFNYANILLGSMRDMVRLENKINKGDMSGIIVQPMTKYNDLIQYVGLIKTNSKTIKNCAELFIKNLLSEAVQKEICKTGLFSTTGEILYKDNERFSAFENHITKLQNIPNVFL